MPTDDSPNPDIAADQATSVSAGSASRHATPENGQESELVQVQVQVSMLTDDDTGLWRVTTQASTYLIDLDTRRALRLPGHRPPIDKRVVAVVGGDGLTYEVTQLLGDGDWERLLRLVHCVVGESMYLFTLPEEHILTTRGSTPVREIRPMPPPVSTAPEEHDG